MRLEDRPALAHAIEAVASGDWPSCALEVLVLQHAREPIQVRLELEPERQQQVRITATDLSAERTAARVLAEQEENLRAMTALSIDMWALIDAEGRIRVVSDSVAVHLGWSPAEVRDRNFTEFVHPDEAERVLGTFQELARDPTTVRTLVSRARHKDGGWRNLESTISGYNPRLLGSSLFVVNARDITARQRAEAALREVESRYAEVIGHSLSGVVVIQRGRLAHANARFLELTGLSPEQVARHPRALALVTKPSRAAFRRVLEELASGGTRATRIVVDALHADGRTIPVEIATGVVEYEGGPALLCTVTDLTEARAMQERVASGEKSQAIAHLAGGIAHDFNNLLMTIVTWTDLAADGLPEEVPAQEALREIRTAADRAADLVRQLLAYGQRQRLDPTPLDLAEAMVRLKRWMDRTIGTRHRIDLTVPEDPWLVRADRGQIESAVAALVLHARDAMPAGGAIQLAIEHGILTRERAMDLSPLQAGEHVVIAVRHRGPPLDEESRRRIFEPFFSTRSRSTHVGAGIGLAAVLGTVRQSGGMIDVSSVPDEGTTFRCYFPRLA